MIHVLLLIERESWKQALQSAVPIVLDRALKAASTIVLKPEGVIKFSMNFNKKANPFFTHQDIEELDKYRSITWKLSLIGVYPSCHPEYANLGYGNISKRWTKDGQFVVTCSQTGMILRCSFDNSDFTAEFKTPL